ncbi:MAG: dihydropyrimidinase [Anaerolineaceae bacterium]|nr:dihydropyrimidinase [Anaerolineaceae bacterium]
MVYDLIIKNGVLIGPKDQSRVDIGIQNGKIITLDSGLVGKESIDASGLYVLPGAIDPHVHLEMPAGSLFSSDDWDSGTKAAAIGGTTTIIDFVEPLPSQSLMSAFKDRLSQAKNRAFIDYSFHMTLNDSTPETLAQITDVIDSGITSFKTYTTYDDPLSDDDFINIFTAMKKNGGLVITHAENDAIIRYMQHELISQSKLGPASHPKSRPANSEGVEIERIVSLAETINAPVYIVHISTERGARALARAKKRGQIVFGETCPQYLILRDDKYIQPGFEGAKYVCSPPLRQEQDNLYLWDALAKDVIQTIGTDHCPFFYKGQKDIGIECFTKIPGGLPGIESRLSLIHTFGVLTNRLDINQWVETCCTNPAKIFGLYPSKGIIEPGSDSDIVLFDPRKKITIRHENLHENVDYTPYEGLCLTGYPVMTILGGQVIAQENEFMGTSPQGSFVKRSI